MTDITIPPEALEAAAREVFIKAYRRIPLECTDDARLDLCREYARAACLALIENWPGMKAARNGSSISLNPHIILPLTENHNDKG